MKNIKTISIIIISVIVSASISVFASTSYVAREISYTTTKNNKVANAEDALNDLYSIATAVPAGTVLSYMADNALKGYLVCDGSAVSRTTYKDLFNAIGTIYGKDNGTVHNGSSYTDSQSPYYTSRPTNTSVLYIIKY